MIESNAIRDFRIGFLTQYRPFLFLVVVALLFIAATTINAQVIFDNGGLVTGAIANSGAAAPAGTQ